MRLKAKKNVSGLGNLRVLYNYEKNNYIKKGPMIIIHLDLLFAKMFIIRFNCLS